MTKQRCIKRIYDKIRSKSPPNRAPSRTCLHCDVTHFSLTTEIVALHIRLWRVREFEERRQTRKNLWPVNAERVICRYRNHLYGIATINIFGILVAILSIITINHIDTGAKTVVGRRSRLWRTRLLAAGRCSFTHPAVKGNHYSFAPQIHAVMLWYKSYHY